MLKVYWGSMFAQKSMALFREVLRARAARRKVQCFKFDDGRYSTTEIVTHDGLALKAEPVRDSAALVAAVEPDTQVIIVDEAQFFDEGLVTAANRWADEGRTVIAAGLDMDRYGRPFGIMPALAATAEEAVKLHAICVCCGEEGYISYGRATTTSEQMEIGGADKYEARCRRCALMGHRAAPATDVPSFKK
ncbi:MAG: thymidine kinase [Bacillota bacterium]